MSVHYKFKSNLDFDTVTFDGLNISVADLKKAIMQQKKIGKSSDFDLQITNAQTKEVYDDEEMLVPKNTSVIVARIPAQQTTNKKNWEKPDLPLPIDDDDYGQIRYDRIAKKADILNSNTTEDAKVKAAISQSGQEYDPSKFLKSRSMTGPLPSNYTCFRCGKTGHWIKNCPTNNPDVKRSTGIPRSFMIPVDGPEHKGALLTSSGDYAVPLIDHQAYKEVKKEKPPFVPQEEVCAEPEAEIPEELLCMVCKDLLQDAVLIPCCGNSFCDECVRMVLLESDNHECPVCHETDVSPNTLIPNRFLRTAVMNYKNETGYTRIIKATVAKASPPLSQREDSPQPSPDSTVESKKDHEEVVSSHLESSNTESNRTIKTEVPSIKTEPQESHQSSPRNDLSLDIKTEDEIPDIQPGTPLADEPLDSDSLSKSIKEDRYRNDRSDYRDSSRTSRRRHRDEEPEVNTISTIETVQSIRKKIGFQRLPTLRQTFSADQRIHRDGRTDNYFQDRDDYGRYERRHDDRISNRRDHYDRDPRNPRYTSSSRDYHPSNHPHYDAAVHGENRRLHDRYRSPPLQALHIPPVLPPPIYAPPTVPPPPMLPLPPVYPPQPPPPGASPISSSHLTGQPPPPGVGPIMPPPASDYKKHTYDEDTLKDIVKSDERSIDDRMEAFQRELEKKDKAFARDRASRSRSRSTPRRSRSISRSRSFSSSKSWTRSTSSRSSTRSSRSRSRSPFSSRSRTRSSYTPSRSRSWSKKRSYTRSRSRGRSVSRSRSRSRVDSRPRRRSLSRDRIRPTHHRSRSRSYSPREYRGAHKTTSYSRRKEYTPPPPPFLDHYQYPPQQQPIMPIQAIGQSYPVQSYGMHHPIPPIHSRPIDPYAVERQSKYPPNNPPHKYPYDRMHKYPPNYSEYPENVHSDYQKYPQPRFERERSGRYDKRQEFERQDRRQEFDRQDRRQEYERPDRRQEYERIDRRQEFERQDRRQEYDRDRKQEFDRDRKQEFERPDRRQEYERQDRRQEYERQDRRRVEYDHEEKREEFGQQILETHHIPGLVGDRSRDHKQKYWYKEDRQRKAIKELPQVSESELRTMHMKSEEEVVPKKREKESTTKHKKHHHHHKGKESRKQERVAVDVGSERSESSRNPESVLDRPEQEKDSLSKLPKVVDKVKEKKHRHRKHKTTDTVVKKKKSKKDKGDVQPGTDSDLSTKVKKKKMKSKAPLAEKQSKSLKSVSEAEEEKEMPDEQPLAQAPDPPVKVSETNNNKASESDVLDIFADADPEVADLVQETRLEVEAANTSNVSVEIASSEAENIQESNTQSDNEDGENVEDHELHVDLPALSKWEREDIEEREEDIPRMQRKIITAPTKEEKESLSSDILHRAERALLSKPPQPMGSNKDEIGSGESSERSTPEVSRVRRKENVELKSVVSSDRLKPDGLKVTISNSKDKRSVYTKKEEGRVSREDTKDFSSKRIRLDKVNFKNQEDLILHKSSREDYRSRDDSKSRDRPDRRDHRYSSPQDKNKNISREKRDHSRRSDKSKESQRDLKKSRVIQYKHSRQERSEKTSSNHSRSRKEVKSLSRTSELKSVGQKRPRSDSSESEDSHTSHNKQKIRVMEESPKIQTKGKEDKSVEQITRRRHSPIRPPESHSAKPHNKDFEDITKFEPDYDEFSDIEEKREKINRKSASPEKSKKRIKSDIASNIVRTIKNEKVAESSASSSYGSDSQSSDSDSDRRQKQKKSKHKKHRKHKHTHKHKKKRSHKTR